MRQLICRRGNVSQSEAETHLLFLLPILAVTPPEKFPSEELSQGVLERWEGKNFKSK